MGSKALLVVMMRTTQISMSIRGFAPIVFSVEPIQLLLD